MILQSICWKMDALRHSKRHHNIETETVVRLAVKLMRSNSSSSSFSKTPDDMGYAENYDER